MGTGLKVRTRALYQLRVPLSPGFQTPGPRSACQTRLDHQRPLPLFSNPNQVSSLLVPPALQPPRLGLGSGLPRKIRSASKQPLAPSSPQERTHPPLAAVAAKRGSEEGERNTFPGREEWGGKWVGLPSFGVGVNSRPSRRSSGKQISPGPAKTDSPVPGKFTR